MAENESVPEARQSPVTALDDGRGAIADLRSHTARGMLINGSFQVLLVAVSALRGLVVAFFLTRSAYGVWGIVGLTIWTTLGFKAIFGAGDKYVQQSEQDQELAFQRAFTVELVYAAALIPVNAAIVLAVAAISGYPQVIAPGLTLLALIPAIALQFPIAAFTRRMDYRRQRILQAIQPLGGAVVMIGLAAIGAGYWSFVGGSLFGAWVTALVALSRCPYQLAIRFDRQTLRRYFGFSSFLFVSAVSEVALFYIIILVGGAGPLGLAGVGAFTLVGNIAQFTDRADAIVTETLYPAVCAVSDRIRLLSEIFVKSNRLSLMWAAPFGIGLTLFGADLVHFGLGNHWLPALPLLQIIGAVTAVGHVGYNWSAFVKARGQTWPIAATGAIVATATIAAAIPLMFRYHLIGVGYAFAIGQAVAMVARGVIVARLFNGVRLLTHLLRSLAPTAVAALAVLAVRGFAARDATPGAAIAVFFLYILVTAAATICFERALVLEAWSYLSRRREPAAVSSASSIA